MTTGTLDWVPLDDSTVTEPVLVEPLTALEGTTKTLSRELVMIVAVADMPTFTALEGFTKVRVTGNVTTLLEDVPLAATADTVAGNCWPERALRVTVAVWPTSI
jgi:hypothetical protein